MTIVHLQESQQTLSTSLVSHILAASEAKRIRCIKCQWPITRSNLVIHITDINTARLENIIFEHPVAMTYHSLIHFRL
jgi:hypothetical protein